MAIPDLATLKQKILNPRERVQYFTTGPNLGGSATGPPWSWDQWRNSTIPGNNAVPANTVAAGAMGQVNAGSGTLTIVSIETRSSFSGAYLLCDRLVHSSGLSATTTGTQTTNLPTAALTRYTNGVGVRMGLSALGAIGATLTSATASYTNEAGTTGRTSLTRAVGSNSFGATTSGKFLELPLQPGDKGVRSVESVTFAATTGTAGFIHVVLFKPLMIYVLAPPEVSGDHKINLIDGGMAGGFPAIQDNAALFLLHIPGPASPNITNNYTSAHFSTAVM